MKDKEIPQWEIDLRAKLEKELPEGYYQIGNTDFGGRFSYGTNKEGKIEFEVALQRIIHERKTGFVTDAIYDTQIYPKTSMTEDDIIAFLKESINKMKTKNRK